MIYSVLLLSFFFAYQHAHAQDDNIVGKAAPDFSLKNVDGNMVSMSDFDNDNGIILIFTCNHCPYSKLYEDRIMELDAEFSPEGYPVVAINPNDPVQYPEDSYESMIERANEKGYTFPYLIDETQEVAKAYHASRTPHVYLLKNDGEGHFTVAYVGAIDDSPKEVSDETVKYVDVAIRSLIANEAFANTYTKAIGCGIKWKQ